MNYEETICKCGHDIEEHTLHFSDDIKVCLHIIRKLSEEEIEYCDCNKFEVAK